MLRVRGVAIAPPGTAAFNPAFDVTPAELITGIVTDEGVLRAPFEGSIAGAVEANHARWAAEPRIADLMRAARGEAPAATGSVPAAPPADAAPPAVADEARPSLGERLGRAG